MTGMIITKEEKAKVAEAMKAIEEYISENIVPRMREDIRINFGIGHKMKVCMDGSVYIDRGEDAISLSRVANYPLAVIIVTNWQDIKAKLNEALAYYDRLHFTIMNFEI